MVHKCNQHKISNGNGILQLMYFTNCFDQSFMCVCSDSFCLFILKIILKVMYVGKIT